MPEKGTRLHHVSLSDFADLLGKHRTTVQSWIRAGMPVRKSRGGQRGSHIIDLGPAFRWLIERAEAACEERLAALTASPDANKARARKLAAEADIAEMERDRQKGELVGTVDVEERWAGLMVAIRESVMGIPGVAVQSGLIPATAEGELESVCRDALVSFGAL